MTTYLFFGHIILIIISIVLSQAKQIEIIGYDILEDDYTMDYEILNLLPYIGIYLSIRHIILLLSCYETKSEKKQRQAEARAAAEEEDRKLKEKLLRDEIDLQEQNYNEILRNIVEKIFNEGGYRIELYNHWREEYVGTRSLIQDLGRKTAYSSSTARNRLCKAIIELCEIYLEKNDDPKVRQMFFNSLDTLHYTIKAMPNLDNDTFEILTEPINKYNDTIKVLAEDTKRKEEERQAKLQETANLALKSKMIDTMKFLDAVQENVARKSSEPPNELD